MPEHRPQDLHQHHPVPLPAGIEEVFSLALELEPDARETFLERASRDDPQVGLEVRSLVDAWFSAPDFLEQTPLFNDAGGHPAPDATSCSSLDLQQLLRHWDRYALEERLGSGSTSLVYRATERQTGRAVAIKFLVHLGDHEIARFQREAEALVKIQHEAVLQLFETGSIEGVPFLVTRLVEGPGLLALRQDTTLEEKVRIILQMTRGLEAAHEQQVIHRDIKPSNILLENREGTWIPYLADFGIARDPESRGLTATGMLVGTPAYLAPERLQTDSRPLDARCDLYSLGVTFYEFLTGRRPHSAPYTLEVLLDISQGNILLPREAQPDLPIELETVLLHCLEMDPQNRYPTAKALAEDLESYLRGAPVAAPRRVSQTNAKSSRRLGKVNATSTTAVAVGAAATAVVIVVIVLIIWAILHQLDASKTHPQQPVGIASNALLNLPPAISAPHQEGQSRLRTLEFVQAKDILETALESDPDHPQLLVDLSMAWLGMGYDAKASGFAETALAHASELAEAERLRLAGHLYRTLYDWHQAAMIFEGLRTQQPADLELGLQLIAVFIRDSKNHRALALLDELKALPPPTGDDPRLDLLQAEAATALAEYDLADLAIRRAMHRGEALQAPLIVAQAQLQKAYVQRRRISLDEALMTVETAKQIFVEQGDSLGTHWALMLLGDLRSKRGHFEEAKLSSQKTLSFFTEIGHQKGRAQALYQHTVSNYRLANDTEQAHIGFEEVLSICRQTNDRRGIANAHNSLGLLASRRDSQEEAAEHYHQAIEYQRQIDDREGLARSLSNLSIAQQIRQNLPQAVQSLEESLVIRRQIGNPYGIAFSSLNLGHLYRLKGSLESAKERYQEGLRMAQQAGALPIQARSTQGLGWVAYLRRDLAAARRHHEESLLLHADSDAPSSPAFSRIVLAKILLEDDQPKQAEAAISEISEDGSAAWAHTILAQALAAQGKHQIALAHIDEARTLRRENIGFSSLAVHIDLARTETKLDTENDHEASRAILESALEEAIQGGKTTVECQARLALATFGQELGQQWTESRKHLEKVVEIAETRGLKLYLHQAREALER